MDSNGINTGNIVYYISSYYVPVSDNWAWSAPTVSAVFYAFRSSSLSTSITPLHPLRPSVESLRRIFSVTGFAEARIHHTLRPHSGGCQPSCQKGNILQNDWLMGEYKYAITQEKIIKESPRNFQIGSLGPY